MLRMTVILSLLLLFLAPAPALSEQARVSIPLLDSPSLGPENAPITIVEFIDFQ
jgi:biopolymer transport protein ExbD